ncbi:MULTISPECIES: histidine triad nucleotide-binding protein [Olsenella]|uniref:histidine triad nucleotide-binding protein n=1 Tax=Olsenella TaxID=133925 RepID=UPI00071E0210|nr:MULTISPECIES: histidine triad nucleotide-binding protein [Olsenella]OFK24368.1 histidine triad nucleotide-binding protein [Olsenella sp. HMSC062G07]
MATRDDCIFCKIANHQVESDYVYEDDLVCAFRDVSPLAPTHVLIVPKEHYDDVLDGVPAKVLEALAHAAGEVARSEGVESSGFRLVTNKGDDAGQTVRHLHVHLLGGRELSPDMGEGAAVRP